MCFVHGLMAELSVKTNIVKVLKCNLVNNRLTPPGGYLKTATIKYTFYYNNRITQQLNFHSNFNFAKRQISIQILPNLTAQQRNFYPNNQLSGYNWLNVSLDEFSGCHDNWANNRQTRMLADLRLVNCDGSNMTSQEFDDVLLKSAKRNLLVCLI